MSFLLCCQSSEILALFSNGDHSRYRDLVSDIQSKRHLMKWFNDLSQCVTQIKPEHSLLLNALFSYDWVGSTDIVLSYSELLIHLNAAHGHVFITKTFESIVTNFLKPKDDFMDDKRYFGIDDKNLVYGSRISPYQHQVLKRILESVPDSIHALSGTLISNFPHKVSPTNVHQLYIDHVILVMSYCPFLRDQLLHVVIDRLIQIDVEIKIESIPDEEKESQQEETQQTYLGVFEIEKNEEELSKREVEENANKLDSGIVAVIEFIKKCSPSERDEIFDIMMKIFDKTILVTQSKYIQFIIFYLCQISPQHTNKFIFQNLLDKVLKDNHNYTSVTRYSAMQYLGSFMCRAKFVEPEVTQETLTRLKIWLLQYLDDYGELQSDTDRHGLFYLVFQMVLYIICYKCNDIEQLPDGRTFLMEFGFQKLVHSKLNPFKAIGPEVVEEFNRISKKLEMDFRSVIQQNQSFLLIKPIESFFPFDPCLLKTTSQYFSDNTFAIWEREESDSEEEQTGNLEPSEDFYSESGDNTGHGTLSPLPRLRNNSNDPPQGGWSEQRNLSSLDFESGTPMSFGDNSTPGKYMGKTYYVT